MNVVDESQRGSAHRILSLTGRGALCALLSAALVLAGTPHRVRAAEPVPAGEGNWGSAPSGGSRWEPAPSRGAPNRRASNGGSGYAEGSAAIAAGEADAVADTSGALWFTVGCLVGVLGVVLGYVVEPSPPPARLLGKSPEYAMTYTQSYRHAGKREQGSKAITGCLVGTAVGVVLYLAVLSSVANSTDTTTY